MTTPAERHLSTATTFGEVVNATTDWDAPSPVPEWSARDVVGHLVEWLTAFLADGGVHLHATTPSSADDPVVAWGQHAAAVQALLEAPDADRDFTHSRLGTQPLDAAIDRFYTDDIFMHTWDLARATGQDTVLDPRRCEEMLAGMQQAEDIIRASGQFGSAAMPVADDAPAQDRLMAFIGRDPQWQRN